jgi:hypothetical protein
MRTILVLGTLVFALVVITPLSAQTRIDKGKATEGKPGKDKAAQRLTSRAVLANLQTEIKLADLGPSIKLSEMLDYFGGHLKERGREVVFSVDEEAYRDEAPDAPNVFDTNINLRGLPAKTSIQAALRYAVQRLPIKSAFLVREGKVDIVPIARTAKEYMLNQTFYADFKQRPLDEALEELSDLTGVSIVMDARVKEKALTPVSARFHDDVAVQDAARMLADMADLKIVYLVTGIYVTTPDHAKEMQRELKDLYEPRTAPFGPMGGFGVPPGAGGIGPGPGTPQIELPVSPLAPPLPPSRRVREAGA